MIKIEGMGMKFEGKVIFENFTHNFELGKVHVLMGTSGCGKTTLLRIIAGLQKPTSGKIFLNDKEIKKPNDSIYMMHQHYTNFDWLTCLENVIFALKIKKKNKIFKEEINEAREILKFVGLSNYEDKYPIQLSGGMNQRLAFARTIVIKPNIILMDEPMSALDSLTRRQMQDLLKNLHKITNNTILMVTHSEDECNYMADEIFRFSNLEVKK